MRSVSTKLEKIQNNKSLHGIYKTFVELNLCVCDFRNVLIHTSK